MKYVITRITPNATESSEPIKEDQLEYSGIARNSRDPNWRSSPAYATHYTSLREALNMADRIREPKPSSCFVSCFPDYHPSILKAFTIETFKEYVEDTIAEYNQRYQSSVVLVDEALYDHFLGCVPPVGVTGLPPHVCDPTHANYLHVLACFGCGEPYDHTWVNRVTGRVEVEVTRYFARLSNGLIVSQLCTVDQFKLSLLNIIENK